MGSLKRIFKSALDDRSPRFMLATIALGVVVALIAGTLIGYKLDSSGSGGGTPKKAKAAAVKKKKHPAKRSNHAVAAPLLIGSVASARPAKIVVVSANGKRVPLVIGGRTQAETATPSNASSITVGSKVLWAATSTGSTSAAEVVVLPSSSSIGTPVTAVTPSTSMTIGGIGVSTRGATVLRATASNRNRIPSGSKVAVVYFVLRGKRGAVEIVILPAGSKL